MAFLFWDSKTGLKLGDRLLLGSGEMIWRLRSCASAAKQPILGGFLSQWEQSRTVLLNRVDCQGLILARVRRWWMNHCCPHWVPHTLHLPWLEEWPPLPSSSLWFENGSGHWGHMHPVATGPCRGWGNGCVAAFSSNCKKASGELSALSQDTFSPTPLNPQCRKGTHTIYIMNSLTTFNKKHC